MTYVPSPHRRVLLLRPAKYARGDGYGAFGPDGNRLLEFWKAHGADTAVREIDVTAGAHMSAKEALAFGAKAGDPWPAASPAPKAAMGLRFKRLLSELDAWRHAALRGEHGGEIDTLVIACHGWTTGLQLGVTTSNVGLFADALIAAGLLDGADIFIAACSAGSGSHEGNRSVADTLRDALAARNMVYVRVWAHTEAGMAFRCPYVRVFRGNGSKVPLTGGAYLVNPKSPAFKPWNKAMTRKSEPPGGWLWCKFFDMEDDEILRELGL